MSSDRTTCADASAAMMRIMAGGWVAHIVHTAAEIGLADHFDQDAKDPASLANATATHPPSLARFLRALAAIGLVDETDDRRYTLTPLGATLRTAQPGSMRAWARVILREETERPWQALTHAIRTGDNAFQHVFGTDPWTYRSMHSDFSTLFNDSQQSVTQGVNATISTHYPFGNFGRIVDVGGGNGALLISILQQHLHMRGTVFELSHVAVQARERIAAAGLADRCDAVDGNAFGDIPSGADAYVMKSVLHGKTDEQAVAILINCRAALAAHARLLIIERLLPERVDPDDMVARGSFLMDVSMMLTAGGRERSEAEYQHLLAEAGLCLVRVVPTLGTSAIIEAERA